jgi:hypothetical protein
MMARHKHTVHAFGSLVEYQRAINARRPAYDGWSQASDWTHNATGADAARMLVDGWPEGAQQIRQALDAPSLAVPTETMVYDIAGAYPDVGRFIAGEPESMVRWDVDTERTYQGRSVVLYASMSVFAGVPNEHIINRGAAIVATVRTLIESGACVTLYGIHSFALHGVGRWTVSVRIFDGGGTYHLGQLAFALMHPAVQRHLTHELEARDESKGLSRVGPLCDLREAPEPGAVLFPQVSCDPCWSTYESAAAVVSRIVDTIGRSAV